MIFMIDGWMNECDDPSQGAGLPVFSVVDDYYK